MTFAETGPVLISRGWSAIPVRGKKPDIAGLGCNSWNGELPTQGVVADWRRRYPGENTGIAVGPCTVVVDADVLDEGLAGELAAACDEVLGSTPLVRVGRAPKW